MLLGTVAIAELGNLSFQTPSAIVLGESLEAMQEIEHSTHFMPFER